MRSQKKKGTPWDPEGHIVRLLLFWEEPKHSFCSFLLWYECRIYWKLYQVPFKTNIKLMMISALAVVYRRGWRTKTAMWKKDLLRFSGKDTNQWNSPSPRWKRFPNWSWERSGRSGTLLRRKGAKCHQLLLIPTMVSLLHHQRLWKVKSKRDLLATWRRA